MQSHHRHGRGPELCVDQQLLHERLGWATLGACCVPAQHIHDFGQQKRTLGCVYVWFVFVVCMYVIWLVQQLLQKEIGWAVYMDLDCVPAQGVEKSMGMLTAIDKIVV